MDVTIKDLGDLVLYLGAVAAALGAIGVVFRYVFLRPLQRWIAEQITSKISGPLHTVKSEVTSNGGSSMKDRVGNTNQAVKILDAKVTTLSERFDRHLENHN